jgi:hypothetical protein
MNEAERLRPPKPLERETSRRPSRAEIRYLVTNDRVIDHRTGEKIKSTYNGFSFLLEEGYLDQGGVVAIQGMQGDQFIGGGHERIEAPIHVIGAGPRSGFSKIKLGRSRGGIEEIHFWGVNFDNPDHSYSPINTEDAHSPINFDNGLLCFHGCTFEKEEGVWKSEFDQKWAVNGKGAARWFFEDMQFPPCLEHGAYLHYPQSMYFENCTFAETGGTGIQAANRAGRVVEGMSPEYYGNPYWMPAGSAGPAVISNCHHIDGDGSRPKLYRDAYSFTFAGYCNDIYIFNSSASGAASGGVVCWGDWGKGFHYTDGTKEAGAIVGPRPGKFVHGKVFVHKFELRAPHCKREAMAFSGCEEVHYGRNDIHASTHWLNVFGAEGGGPLANGSVQFHRPNRQSMNTGTWNGSGYELLKHR